MLPIGMSNEDVRIILYFRWLIY